MVVTALFTESGNIDLTVNEIILILILCGGKGIAVFILGIAFGVVIGFIRHFLALGE